MMKKPIYLDYNASTPPDPAVIEAMLPWLRDWHANPHSSHLAGSQASVAVDRSRAAIATLIGASPDDLIFTSGATEANNLALRGLAEHRASRTRLVHSAIEHKAIIDVGTYLSSIGMSVSSISTDRFGQIDMEEAEVALSGGDFDLKLASLMHANNEIGSVQPIAEFSKLVKRFGGLLHVDGAQTVGRVEVDVAKMGIDLLSISAHKLYGPAGIGALCVAPEIKRQVRPLMFGGGQQQGLRPGTLPVFLIVGFGEACSIAARQMATDACNTEAVADHFCRQLQQHGVSFTVFESKVPKLPGLRSICFHDMQSHDLVLRVAPWLSVSAGSACTSHELRSSHVLRAIGLTEDESNNVVRVGFGRFSTNGQAEVAAEVIAKTLQAAGMRS